jgi:hypothetical protein
MPASANRGLWAYQLNQDDASEGGLGGVCERTQGLEPSVGVIRVRQQTPKAHIIGRHIEQCDMKIYQINPVGEKKTELFAGHQRRGCLEFECLRHLRRYCLLPSR